LKLILRTKSIKKCYKNSKAVSRGGEIPGTGAENKPLIKYQSNKIDATKTSK
jgi:hypothetical protein